VLIALDLPVANKFDLESANGVGLTLPVSLPISMLGKFFKRLHIKETMP
jgi:hypothetical protein